MSITIHTISLVSVNIGELQSIPGAKKKTPTGIYKKPVQGPASVGVEGLVGDKIGSTKYHGGPDQALHIYSQEDYQWWEAQLDRAIPPGSFGENLTVSSFSGREPRLGDVWSVGEILIELSAPRIPCSTLAARMGDPQFVKKFAKSERSGFYARVLKTGTVRAGDPVSFDTISKQHPSIKELFTMWHQKQKDPELIRRALEAPIARLARKDLEKWLSKSQPLGL